MNRLSFTLAALMLLIAYIAVGLIAWRESSYRLAETAHTMAYCALLASFITLLSTRAERRIFWIGFALFGCFYFITANIGEVHGPRGLLDELFDLLHNATTSATGSSARAQEFDHRSVIWDSWFTIVFGCIGGTLSRLAYIRSRDKRRNKKSE